MPSPKIAQLPFASYLGQVPTEDWIHTRDTW